MVKAPVVSGVDVVRTLQRLGFIVARQRGSHIVMRRGSSGCVVPNHRELKVGTLVGLLKQAGVSMDEFIEKLGS
jgi:predicted RNA binding protein YcfA (HicA-like mRNA interferase family)